jgi:hypothetical protein
MGRYCCEAVKCVSHTLGLEEREILARERTLLQNEQRLTSLLNQKDQDITSLQQPAPQFH